VQILLADAAQVRDRLLGPGSLAGYVELEEIIRQDDLRSVGGLAAVGDKGSPARGNAPK
jgi:hypothetical protein